MPIYSGYIECGNGEADYEFRSDEILDAMGQLRWLLDTGTLQIIDNAPQDDEDEEDADE
jgi:hypothetical protein